VPVTAPRGRSHIASSGFTCSGLVQMAFWSKRIRFGVPRKVIGAGFGGSAGAGRGLLCGSGASGSEVEVAVAMSTVGRWGAAFWAGQSGPVASRRVAAKQKEALSLGCVKGIGKGMCKFGRQLTAPLAGGYHRRTVRMSYGTQVRNRYFSGGAGAVVPPPPPGGYFWRKIFVFSGLQRVGVCKILITGDLQLKYFLSIS
jgi:hypothetical protein